MSSNSQDTFFELSDPMANRPLRLGPDDEWCESDTFTTIHTGRMRPERPVVLRAVMGGQAADFLWTTSYWYISVSTRVLDLLTTNGFTGWNTYPVEIYGRKGELLPGYSGLAITGREVPWDRSRSQITRSTRSGPPYPEVRRGMYFDEALWDGSDFFRVAYLDAVTGKVAKAFKRARVTNIKLTPADEIEELLLMDKFRKG